MPNEFFEPGQQRAVKVNELFTRIARRYDLLNDLMSFGLHRRWKRRVTELARIEKGITALDVCCGTGDISFALAAAGAETTGLDFNQQMLSVADARKSKQVSAEGPSRPGPSLPRFITGDAMQLPFPDQSFDAVTVGYGLRNLASWQKGLEEMHRVAKPGGRIIVLDFGKPDQPLWRAIYFRYLKLFVPCLGFLFCGSASAYAYILESLQHFPAQHGIAEHMQQLGMTQVRIVCFLGGVMSINFGEKPLGGGLENRPGSARMQL